MQIIIKLWVNENKRPIGDGGKGHGAAFSLTAAGERITLAGMSSKFFP